MAFSSVLSEMLVSSVLRAGSKFSTRRERMVRAMSRFSQAICKSSAGSATSSSSWCCSGCSSFSSGAAAAAGCYRFERDGEKDKRCEKYMVAKRICEEIYTNQYMYCCVCHQDSNNNWLASQSNGLKAHDVVFRSR